MPQVQVARVHVLSASDAVGGRTYDNIRHMHQMRQSLEVLILSIYRLIIKKIDYITLHVHAITIITNNAKKKKTQTDQIDQPEQPDQSK